MKILTSNFLKKLRVYCCNPCPSLWRIFCHLNSVYILSHRQIIFWDLFGHVLQMRNKVLEFSFLPQGSNKGQKMTFCGEVQVTGTLSTFHRKDEWYSSIWFGMSRRCAIRFGKFHFIPSGQIRDEKRRFKWFSNMKVIHVCIFLHCCYYLP